MQPITVTKTDRWGRTHSTEVYFDGSVYRWASNGRIPPTTKDELEYGFDKLPGYDVATQTDVRDRETAAFFAQYREAQRKAGPPSGEHLAEMRNAFGPGAVVVDVISGRRTQL